MKISESLQKSLVLANNGNTVTDSAFRKLLENCFAVLGGSPELHNVTNLYNSKADLVKELYAALLSVTAEFVRTGQTREAVTQFLSKNCSYSPARTKTYGELYDKHKEDIEVSLLNVGNHLPHITDVTWKVDYIIKFSFSDSSGGPLFRIGLQTEKYDPQLGGKRVDYVNFTCDSIELQDLVYKLKDAIRHCQRIGSEL